MFAKKNPTASAVGVVNTLESGVNPELIVDALIKKGFEPRFAYTLLFQMIRNQSIDTLDEDKPVYQNVIPAIGHKGK